MMILDTVLADALGLAIREQEKIEKVAGHTGDSAMVLTWKQALEALRKRDNVIIWKSDDGH
jgi:hypothetical protein